MLYFVLYECYKNCMFMFEYCIWCCMYVYTCIQIRLICTCVYTHVQVYMHVCVYASAYVPHYVREQPTYKERCTHNVISTYPYHSGISLPRD